MTTTVVYLDERLGELDVTDRDLWLAWLAVAGVDPLEVVCPSVMVWNDRTKKLVVENRWHKKVTMTIAGEVPQIPPGYFTRKQRAKVSTSYVVIQGYAWMQGDESGINYETDKKKHETIEEAISHGFTTTGSDDFNIGKLENDRLTELLWMDQVIPETPVNLIKIARAVGFRPWLR